MFTLCKGKQTSHSAYQLQHGTKRCPMNTLLCLEILSLFFLFNKSLLNRWLSSFCISTSHEIVHLGLYSSRNIAMDAPIPCRPMETHCSAVHACTHNDKCKAKELELSWVLLIHVTFLRYLLSTSTFILVVQHLFPHRCRHHRSRGRCNGQSPRRKSHRCWGND